MNWHADIARDYLEFKQKNIARDYLKFMHTTINAGRTRKDLAARKIHLRKYFRDVAGSVAVIRADVARRSLTIKERETELFKYLDFHQLSRKGRACVAVEEDKEELELECVELAKEEVALKAAEALLETTAL